MLSLWAILFHASVETLWHQLFQHKKRNLKHLNCVRHAGCELSNRVEHKKLPSPNFYDFWFLFFDVKLDFWVYLSFIQIFLTDYSLLNFPSSHNIQFLDLLGCSLYLLFHFVGKMNHVREHCAQLFFFQLLKKACILNNLKNSVVLILNFMEEEGVEGFKGNSDQSHFCFSRNLIGILNIFDSWEINPCAFSHFKRHFFGKAWELIHYLSMQEDEGELLFFFFVFFRLG